MMGVEFQESHLADEILDRFLNDQLPSEQSHALETHLSTCERCATRLTTIAGQPWAWSEVSDSLVDDEFDNQWSNDGQTESPVLEFETPDSAADDEQRQSHELLQRELAGWLDPTDDPQMIGRLAGYEILGAVGHGGMGIVLKGFERSLNRFVAIKVLAPRLASNGAARQRFEREARAAAAVLHDNVIAIHRVDQWHGLPFLVMPYVAGESLQQRIDREGPLAPEAFLRISQQIAAGLGAAHAQGLVHRDIKPANILLEQGVERVTITDFGLARAADDARITRSGFVTGTPLFMSPEQAGAEPIDQRSDLFSLGSVMYAMATGRPPFEADDYLAILNRIREQPARDIRDLQETTPEWMVELISWCHAKAPSERPQTAAELERALGEWLAHIKQPQQVAKPACVVASQTVRRDAETSRWKRTLYAVIGGSLLGLAALFITIETNKGTVTIESDADNVPLVIKRNGKLYDKLTVHRDSKSIRVWQGEYEITFDGKYEHLVIENGTLSLKRGQNPVVKVRTWPAARKADFAQARSKGVSVVMNSQLYFTKPFGLGILFPTLDPKEPTILPARIDLPQGMTHKFFLSDVPGFEGAELSATVELREADGSTKTFLDHNAIAVEFTVDDFEQALANQLVTKVVYLPHAPAVAALDTLHSAEIDAGMDLIAEANKRGRIVAVVRLGNRQIQPALPEANEANTATRSGNHAASTIPVDGKRR